MTDQQPAEPECILDACTQTCTTECREVINRAWYTLRGLPVPAEPARRHTADTITSDALDHLYAEIERLKLLVAASSEEGHAVRMAAQYAERAIDNGKRAERAEAERDALKEHLRYVLNYDGPGHCHLIPGRWDKDGSPCAHCARLAAARVALDEHQEQPATAEQRAEETPDRLAHVGWWCWRGDNHGHLTTTPCRSDNVPLHAPTEWADDMRAVIQRIEDGDDEEEQP